MTHAEQRVQAARARVSRAAGNLAGVAGWDTDGDATGRAADALQAARRELAEAEAAFEAEVNPAPRVTVAGGIPEAAYLNEAGRPVRKPGTVWVVTVDDPHVRGFVQGVYGYRPDAARVAVYEDGYGPEAGYRIHLETPGPLTDEVDAARVSNPDGSWVCTYRVREVVTHA